MELNRRHLLLAAGAAGLGLLLIGRRGLGGSPAEAAPTETFTVTHTDAEWRKLLSPGQYAVLRQEGTERAFTSPLNDEHREGLFACAGCAQDLFSSKTKFDSGTGWPSFWRPLDKAVLERTATIPSAWRAPRCVAAAAAVIWAMSSMTARRPPDCATA